ncbi:MAG TPA: TetR/AcrR family transcriptional regulator [Thermodesulfobacteriota bacterium]|nr:TetR/AcrR family transcriptional regulator [Thermodesulfobacteriota bacterium]
MKYELAKYEIKKHKIFNAAFKQIYEQGIARITMRSIAKEVKVNQALLHYYFKDKENLLSEFIHILFNRFIYDIEKRYKESDPPGKKLEAFFTAGKDFLEKQRELFVVMIDAWAYCFRSKKLQKDYAALNRRLTGVMKNIVVEGKESGFFNNVHEDTLAILFVSFVVGIGCLWHMDNRSFNLSEEFDIMTRNLRQLILRNDTGNKPLL